MGPILPVPLTSRREEIIFTSGKTRAFTHFGAHYLSAWLIRYDLGCGEALTVNMREVETTHSVSTTLKDPADA